METQEIEKLQKYLKRHKIILYVIVGFLTLLTYLLIVVSGQVAREEAFQGESKAYDGGFAASEGEDQQEGSGNRNIENGYINSNQRAEIDSNGPSYCNNFSAERCASNTPPCKWCPTEQVCIKNASQKCENFPTAIPTQIPPPTETPIPTIEVPRGIDTPTPTPPCCTISSTIGGGVSGPDGSQKTCAIHCGPYTYYPQKSGGSGWTRTQCSDKAKQLCPERCAYFKIPACR